MRLVALYLFSFVLCIIGFLFINYSFPGMNTQQTIALAFAIGIFYLYFCLLTYINDPHDES